MRDSLVEGVALLRIIVFWAFCIGPAKVVVGFAQIGLTAFSCAANSMDDLT